MINGIWEEFLKIVSREVGSHVVKTWLNAVSLSHWDALDKIIYVQAPNQFVQEWITTNYLDLFQQHLSRLLSVDELKIVFLDQSDGKESNHFIPAVASQQPKPNKHALVQRITTSRNATINKNYLFETFVVGPSNQLAYAAAHAVCEKLGSLYNPLFIYGDSGLGKTHLLHAIGNEVKQEMGNACVLYQTADKFVNEFINAIRFNKVMQFKAKYKQLDVLLIDDIQFISNKEQTQEVFFHIFNTLYDEQKQIVFSSDTEPGGIGGLAERLRSRFAWGLVADIQVPTTETKSAILKHKAEQSGIILADDVIDYIASDEIFNIRELEGALIRISAFATLTNKPIDVALVEKVLHKKGASHSKAINLPQITKIIIKYYRFTLAELRSARRNKHLTHARQIAMYLMKKHTDKSLHEIGTFLGRKDHSTVIHAIQKVENKARANASLHKELQQLERELKL